jgi:hypothetical protein
MKATDSFYYKQLEPQQSCFLALRELITSQNSLIGETVKYGMPCFTFKKKAFCYLWTDKKTSDPYILMVDGKLIDHPMLEDGNRSRMRILRVKPDADLPLTEIIEVLTLGLELR